VAFLISGVFSTGGSLSICAVAFDQTGSGIQEARI
jgi:hypothetical protein